MFIKAQLQIMVVKRELSCLCSICRGLQCLLCCLICSSVIHFLDVGLLYPLVKLFSEDDVNCGNANLSEDMNIAVVIPI